MKQAIAIITEDYTPATGGVAVYWSELFSRLSPEVFTLIAPKTDNQKKESNVIRIPFYYTHIWPHWLRLLFTLLMLQRTQRYTHMIAGQVLPVGTVIVIGYILRIFPSYSVSCHSMDIRHIHGWKRWLAKLILQHSEAAIVNSAYTKDILMHEYALASDHIHVVTPAPAHVPSSVNITELTHTHLTMLSVGRLVKRKGVDMVLKALPNIFQKFPELRYVIIGEGPDREYLESLKQQYIPADKQQQVVFTGRLSDMEVAAYYHNADIFVLPTRDINGDVEGFGIVNIEASAYGLPVVAGNVGGVPETVQDGRTGFLVDGTDHTAVQHAILRLLKDETLRKSLGERGRDFAQTFSWDASAHALEQIYDLNYHTNI